MKAETFDAEQDLVLIVRDLVRRNVIALCDNIVCSGDSLIDLERRLVDIGIEVFAPSVMMILSAGGNLRDKKITEMISFWYIEAVFIKIIKNKISYFKWCVNEIHSFAKNITCLSTYIVDCKFSSSDSHNLGRETIFFDICHENSKRKYVFKPSCCASQRLINNFVCCFFEKNLNSTPIQHIITYKKDEYCIKEFVKNEHLFSSEDISQYLYGLGVVMCISMYTRATDLHFENVVPSKKFPHLIDAEIILDDLCSNNVDAIHNSGLLQYIDCAKNKLCIFSNIGIGIKNGCVDYVTENKYTDHLIGNCNFSISEKNLSILCTGFSDCFKNIKHRKNHFINISKEILRDENIKLRYIVRFTALYKAIQLKLWTPIPLSIEKRKEKIKHSLACHGFVMPKRQVAENISRVIDAEIADFDEGDIPFFWIDSAGSLCHRTGFISNRHDNATPSKLIEQSIRSACALQLEEILIPHIKRAFSPLMYD